VKKSFVHRHFQLDYLSIGEGDKAIICLHGFGRRAEDFEVFQSLLQPDQRLIAINLFAHQSSVFPAERIHNHPLQPAEWKELMVAFFAHENIECCDLIGYSMGGRIAMMTLQLLPQRIQSLLLIAPDGLKINWLYRFASGTHVGKWLYRRFIKRPKFLFWITDVAHSLKLINDKLHRFVYVHLHSEEKRQLVYDAWLIHKLLFPDLDQIAQHVRNGMPFNMVFGKYDSVIVPALGKAMSARVGNANCYHEIESGHQLINERTARFIAEKGLWPEAKRMVQ
jgi:pimeloyl-ACP methyl ester carboxylesterase